MPCLLARHVRRRRMTGSRSAVAMSARRSRNGPRVMLPWVARSGAPLLAIVLLGPPQQAVAGTLETQAQSHRGRQMAARVVL
jgi:hypothetical protein